MSIYLGSEGQIALQRSADGVGTQGIATILEPGDVNATEKRFSADFPPSALINGDRIEIATQDKSNLELVQGVTAPDGYWYCHVDLAGGIRLYENFGDAITGDKDSALNLVTPSKSQPVYIRTRDKAYNFMGQVTEYSLTTQREAVDLTVLGEDFRDNYANGLISGQGQTSCLWEYKYDQPCDTWKLDQKELPHYYAQLILRLEQGSFFKGQFFIHYEPAAQSVWYEADCVVTSVGFAFAPQQLVSTSIEFVTSGEIKLKVGVPASQLMLENLAPGINEDHLLQEDMSPIDLEQGD